VPLPEPCGPRRRIFMGQCDEVESSGRARLP
jgi:hypothetical protein